jgi:uncharacterized protein
VAQSAGFHESTDLLRVETMDRHRALASIQEELEAVDWYDQRVDAAGDPELKLILAHNRDEEKEHAAMVIEWLRRRDPALDKNLRAYLFTTLPITQEEASTSGEAGGDPAAPEAGDGSLGIGSLRGVAQ